jgi:hypothetical protein
VQFLSGCPALRSTAISAGKKCNLNGTNNKQVFRSLGQDRRDGACCISGVRSAEATKSNEKTKIKKMAEPALQQLREDALTMLVLWATTQEYSAVSALLH